MDSPLGLPDNNSSPYGRVGGSIVDLGPTSVGVREAMVGFEVVASLPAVFRGPMGVSRYYGWTGTWSSHVSCTWRGCTSCSGVGM